MNNSDFKDATWVADRFRLFAHQVWFGNRHSEPIEDLQHVAWLQTIDTPQPGRHELSEAEVGPVERVSEQNPTCLARHAKFNELSPPQLRVALKLVTLQ